MPQGKAYQCAAPHCAKKEKIWPRADNFRQHCQRIHRDMDAEELMHKSLIMSHGPASTAPPVQPIATATATSSQRILRGNHSIVAAGPDKTDEKTPTRESTINALASEESDRSVKEGNRDGHVEIAEEDDDSAAGKSVEKK